MRVPLASTGLREQDIDAAIDVLRSGNLTMGANVAKFEKRWQIIFKSNILLWLIPEALRI